MGFISEWKISSKIIRFRIPSFLEDVMKGLDEPKAIFQLLNWQIFNHFSGKYEAIIYKLCRDYIGVKRTPYMTIQEFRDYIGIKSKEYSEFMRLNQFVISGPCKKINQSDISDIEINPEFKREGRKVLGFYFKVASKSQISIPFADCEPNPAFQFSKITIEPLVQSEYLKIRSLEEISLCIERANEYAEEQVKKGKAVNYGGIYRAAITEGWHIQYAEKKIKNILAEKKRRKEKLELSEREKRELNEKKAIKERIENVINKFNQFPEEKKQELRHTFAETLPEITRKIFIKDGESSPMHRYNFALFIEINSYMNS